MVDVNRNFLLAMKSLLSSGRFGLRSRNKFFCINHKAFVQGFADFFNLIPGLNLKR